jgi:hypothetical protein
MYSDSIRTNISNIKEQETINHSSFDVDYSEMLDYDYYFSLDLDNEPYMDLLTVETQLNFLLDNNLLTDSEAVIANLIRSGILYIDLPLTMNTKIIPFKKIFDSLCTKISFYLGGYFTDEGYITYLINKYHFTNEQIKTLINLIKNR